MIIHNIKMIAYRVEYNKINLLAHWVFAESQYLDPAHPPEQSLDELQPLQLLAQAEKVYKIKICMWKIGH